MALSFNSVKKAYEVFNELKIKNIPSWPEDMEEWSKAKRKEPREETVYGFSKKSDDGWENLVFFMSNPTEEFIKKFDELKDRVPNSSISNIYSENKKLWIFGWF